MPLEVLLLPVKYYPGLRFNRLLRIPRWVRFEGKFESRANHPNLFRLLFLLHRLMLVMHFDGCVYYLISTYEGVGSNIWVLPAAVAGKDTCAGCVLPFLNTTLGQYLECLYWASSNLMVW